MSEPSASARIEIAAPAERVYELITDLANLGSWNAECRTARWIGEVKQAKRGARFVGSNRNGSRRWSTQCTVTAAEPGSAFAYHVRAAGVLDVAIWRFDLTPTETGCLVEQKTWDTRGAFMRFFGGVATAVPDRVSHNTANMIATLEGLKRVAEAR
ncbi:SRPBCC family protein [Nonomuraea sp. NBC_01738]|uniref:SRPBCC family protein n=1 Tax=Nonomuraea sp. NBC_01738 TaxID=2976003 RepID=UPI002E15F939|nr:SRPBCC family protein [Nonomuraea sp. NBC_01738]